MTEELIRQVDEWLSSHRPDYYANLQRGASPDTLDGIEREFDLTLPDSFRSLYRWRDGQRATSFDPLLLNLTFMPLDSVVEHKRILDGMIGADFDDPDWWRRDWVPFLENGGGDFLCLDLGGLNTGSPGQILWHDHEDAEREIIHKDINDFLGNLLHRMATGNLEVA